MTKQPKFLTRFGKDLDILLKKAGQFSIREYSDESGVNYKYISQLRTMQNRQPGRLYADLLKPFTRLKIINISESQQLSLRHRGKPLTLTECKVIFPDLPEQELLESIRQAAGSKERIDTQPLRENLTQTENTFQNLESTVQAPVYQRVFIGRENELHQLQIAFDSVVAGQGSLMMVIGESGIGKTALCDKLSDYVASRGGQTLTGHCFDDGLASLPYLPVVEAIRDCIKVVGFEILRDESSTHASILARIVPEIRDYLKIKLKTSDDVVEERYRLLQAVSGFFKQIAYKQPLLLVLEDLHNADKDTLDMVVHLVRQVKEMRVLIVGTYRDVEADRNHPFLISLAEMRRFAAFSNVHLHRLNVKEVKRMMESIILESVPESLAMVLHRQTEGNPLFMKEFIRFLYEEKLFVRKDGRLRHIKGISSDMPVPGDLSDVIKNRLFLLDNKCKDILSIASVIGSEFDFETLMKVVDTSEDALFAALQNAVRLSVLEEHSHLGSVLYRFRHILYRQVLYEEMIAPQRIKLHQRVARCLEIQHSKQTDAYAAELTDHFSRSNDPEDMTKAIYYGEKAAKNAVEVYAYAEAVQLLDLVLKVQDVLDPANQVKICELLLSLGSALIQTGDIERFLEVEAPRAWSLAQNIDDVSLASNICQQVMWAYFFRSLTTAWGTPEATLWAERANIYAKPNTIARARADAALGAVKCAKDFLEEGVPMLSRALNIAFGMHDSETLWWVAALWLLYASSPQHSQDQLRIANEMVSRSRDNVSLGLLVWSLTMIVDTYLDSGERERADVIWDEIRTLIERRGQAGQRVFSMAGEALFTALDGDLEQSVQMIERLQAYGEEWDLSELTAVPVLTIRLRPLIYLGKIEYALNSILPTVPLESAGAVLCLAHLGRKVEAMAILENLTLKRLENGVIRDEVSEYHDTLLLEAAVLLGQCQVAELLLNRLSSSSMRTTGMFHSTCIARHLGSAAELLNRIDEARNYYSAAVELAKKMRIRPELALARLQLAGLILQHYPDEKSQAFSDLNFCISEFTEMKMEPSLKKALSLKNK